MVGGYDSSRFVLRAAVIFILVVTSLIRCRLRGVYKGKQLKTGEKWKPVTRIFEVSIQAHSYLLGFLSTMKNMEQLPVMSR